MKNMQYHYAKQTTKDLKTARSKKLEELRKASKHNSWFAQQDRIRLARQIEWIEIELEFRDLQEPLF